MVPLPIVSTFPDHSDKTQTHARFRRDITRGARFVAEFLTEFADQDAQVVRVVVVRRAP